MPDASRTRETAVIERIRRAAESQIQNKHVLHGIGDDCAIIRPSLAKDLVFTSDFVLEGRHFTLETHTAADIGHKALARSLSDLAAMGSQPLFCLVSLAVPAAFAANWVDRFYRGLLRLASRYKITLAGGDIARFDHVIADVMCCGQTLSGKALLRSTARPGDRIYVTGELGGSARGFAAKRGKHWMRHLRPEPRVAAGLLLSRLRVSSCMDISDGLALDLARLCLESNVRAQLSESSLPLARGAMLDDALYGGEDYELLFTAPVKTRIPQLLEGLSVSEIGTIVKGRAGEIALGNKVLEPKGFDHFA